MRFQSARGPLAIVGMSTVLKALLRVSLVAADPMAESGVLADGLHLGQELTDLLRFIQEETSVSDKSSQPDVPSLLEVAGIGHDGVESSRPDSCDARQAVGETTAKWFPYIQISTPSTGSSQWIERDPLNMPRCSDSSFVTGHWDD